MVETQPSWPGYSRPASTQVKVWSQDCLSWFKRSVSSQHKPRCQTFAILLERFKRTDLSTDHRGFYCVFYISRKRTPGFPTPVYFYLVFVWSTMPNEVVSSMKPHWQDGTRLFCRFLSFELSNLGLIIPHLPAWFIMTFPALRSSVMSSLPM